MTACRTIAEVEAAADAIEEEPLSQETADRVAAILMAAPPREVTRVLSELAGTP